MSNQIEKYQELQKKSKELSNKKIRLEEQYKNKKQTLKELVDEIKALGYDPNNLSQVIKEIEDELTQKIITFEKEITDVSEKLAKIEE